MDRRGSLDVLSRRKALVLGFYDRHNLGDQAFKTMFEIFFRHMEVYDILMDFRCTDDVDQIPPDTDLVIIGGGDVINPYFMDKIVKLVSGFAGPVYGLSVGIPYDADARAYLDVFDHVFVRSRYDCRLASELIGPRNVTYMPDITLVWQTTRSYSDRSRFLDRMPRQVAGKKVNLGVCVAAPLLRKRPELAAALTEVLIGFMRKDSGRRIHFFAFNTNASSTTECDVHAMREVASRVSMASPKSWQGRINVVAPEGGMSAEQMIDRLSGMDVTLCSRFHSVVFSYMANTPFVTFSETKKIRTLLADMNYLAAYQVDTLSETDAAEVARKLSAALESRSADPYGLMASVGSPLSIGPMQIKKARSVFSEQAPPVYKALRIRHPETTSLESAVSKVQQSLGAFTCSHVSDEDLHRRSPFPLHGKDPLVVARIVCHAVTGNVDHSCLWGLMENLSREDFCMWDAVAYIHGEHNRMSNRDVHSMLTNTYYPDIGVPRRAFCVVDPHSRHTTSDAHRAGWAYVVGHLMNLDASHSMRDASDKLVVDTFADQTFNWASESLLVDGKIPYTRPWLGFLHHTFDTAHSRYNLVSVFNNPAFLDSLPQCRCLVTLSHYLANQVKEALQDLGPKAAHVSVRALVHPTAFVSYNFTFERFMDNPDRKIVQIGAWLRNPYSIYALEVAPPGSRLNPLRLRKCALKGKNMDNYFCPPNFFSDFYKSCKNNEAHVQGCGGADDTLCRAHFDNKFINGMYHKLLDSHNSVDVIERVSNEGYDALLSENIVFLDLVDASAVNTVIECMVRNTLLVVNRHPAVEELLGKSYPGFYDTMLEASFILSSKVTLRAMYHHMLALDKTCLTVGKFMRDFSEMLVDFAPSSSSEPQPCKPCRQ